MNINEINLFLNSLDSKICLILVGPPLSGKDTFIKNLQLDNSVVISRDSIVLELSGGLDYNSAFRTVNQKQVDKILKSRIMTASQQSKNVIINLTNLKSKRRKSFLMKFGSDFKKIAVVFPILSLDEYKKRNDHRTLTEGKTINFQTIKEMVDGFEIINNSENFDKVINLKY